MAKQEVWGPTTADSQTNKQRSQMKRASFMFSYKGLDNTKDVNINQEQALAGHDWALDLPELGVENDRLKATIAGLDWKIKLKEEDFNKMDQKHTFEIKLLKN